MVREADDEVEHLVAVCVVAGSEDLEHLPPREVADDLVTGWLHEEVDRLVVRTDGTADLSLLSPLTVFTDDDEPVWWVAGQAGEPRPDGEVWPEVASVRPGQSVFWRVRFLRPGHPG